jgi:dihydroflavonol-4-reductase
MKVFVTGGTGFIGGHVVRKLRDRGDEVRALVRNADKGRHLAELGCELVSGDLSDEAAIRSGMEGCDAVIHGAALYEVGIPGSKRGPMHEANVRGTERVLQAALEAKIPKVVYISSVVAFGNTDGEVVDEEYRHPGQSFTSYYEQTKYEAHVIARRLIDEQGLPCVIVQPGGVYGPDDHSQLGNILHQFLAGRLPAMMFPEAGINLVHVEDVADGVLLALDKGKPGEQYVLGGQVGTMRDFIHAAARVTGKRPPRFTMPSALIRLSAPAGPLIGPLLGFPPNLREMVSTADGVTFWAKHDKAARELGYSPRGLEQGLRDTLAAEGRPLAAA